MIPTYKEWEDPKIFEINRGKPHAHFIPFESKELAIEDTPEKSKYYQSLNGTWKFNYSKDPNSRSSDFFQLGTDLSSWDDIVVPGNWEMQGYGTLIYLEEEAIPLRPAVRGGAEILGLDPLYLACEGRFVAVVSSTRATEALKLLQGLPGGEAASLIGEVHEAPGRPLVVLRTRVGGERILPVLTGEPLPRIC